MADAGLARRAQDVAAAATVLVVSLVALSPVLWLLGALDEIEWHDDFATGVVVAVAIYAAIATGYVLARWRALVVVWAIAVAWVLIEQLRWEDDPNFSGMDDLPPNFLLPFTPITMLLPAIGVGIAKLRRPPLAHPRRTVR
jgi:hypothetical protein